MPIIGTEPYEQSEAERRYHVERAFAAVERAGGVVSPYVRHLYEHYVAGELTLGQVCHRIDQRAAEVVAQARATFGWVG